MPVITDQTDDTQTPKSGTQPSIGSGVRRADEQDPHFRLDLWDDVNWSAVFGTPGNFPGFEI